jgi:hypothetical protein
MRRFRPNFRGFFASLRVTLVRCIARPYVDFSFRRELNQAFLNSKLVGDLAGTLLGIGFSVWKFPTF